MKNLITKFFAAIGFIALLPVFLFCIVKIFNINLAPKISNNSVLQIDLRKKYPEVQQNNWKTLLQGKGINFLKLLQMVRYAANDKRIKGIVLQMDGSSLGIAQIQELRNVIKDFRKSGKFVYAYSYQLFGLRNYYLASCADKIWMQNGSFVYLSGLHVDKMFFAKLLQKYGVKPEVFAKKEYKNAYAHYTDDKFSEFNKEALHNLLNNLHNHFVFESTSERKIASNTISNICQERTFSNEYEAIKDKLIDKVGYFHQFTEYVKKIAGKGKIISDEMYYRDIVSYLHGGSGTKVAVIYGSGIITQANDHYDMMRDYQLLSAERVARQFEEALKDKSIKAIIFRVNTPGGDSVASETMRAAVLNAQEKGIPVIASISNISASGGVVATTPCKKIIANSTSITGSIGVIIAKMSFKDALAQFDVNVDSVSVGDNGSMFSSLSSLTEHQIAMVNNYTEQNYNRFVQIVAKARGLTVKQVEKVAKGRVWLGQEAKTFGLIDGLGGFFTAVDTVKRELKLSQFDKINLVEITDKKSFIATIKTFVLGAKQFFSKALIETVHSIWRNDTPLQAKDDTLYKLANND